MSKCLRVVLSMAFCVSLLGCSGEPAPPKIDPVESKAKQEEINKSMEKAMQEQMKGKK